MPEIRPGARLLLRDAFVRPVPAGFAGFFEPVAGAAFRRGELAEPASDVFARRGRAVADDARPACPCPAPGGSGNSAGTDRGSAMGCTKLPSFIVPIFLRSLLKGS
ncbi:MAG: hypothetical protein CMN28_06245 [Salinisphaeraceae bacterium]|nr:hypothetical protein [Salinisphaeraceae bacterium]